ncbi:MAG: hypothetical protein ACRDJJ_03270 [Actinomycetota bacterium]
MRRVTVCLLVALAAVLALAAPAAAQLRDPFDPLVTEGEGTTGGAAEDTTQGGGTEVQPQPATEVDANTGGDPSPFLVVAYGLLALGVGAVVISRTLGPQPVRSRTR